MASKNMNVSITNEKATYWIYILLCSNNAFYIGYTKDLARRYQAHLSGKGSKYTRSFKPQSVAQSWKIYGLLSDALKIEAFLKSLSRLEKQKFIADRTKLNLHYQQADWVFLES